MSRIQYKNTKEGTVISRKKVWHDIVIKQKRSGSVQTFSTPGLGLGSHFAQGHWHAGTGLSQLGPVKENLNVTEYKDIINSSRLYGISLRGNPHIGVMVRCLHTFGNKVYLLRRITE